MFPLQLHPVKGIGQIVRAFHQASEPTCQKYNVQYTLTYQKSMKTKNPKLVVLLVRLDKHITKY